MKPTLRMVFAAALAVGLLGPFASIGGAAPEAAPERPKIGLALSGGGAKGAAHVGVLRALEKMQIPVDYIAGTSMGAVIGGLYASGMGADELQKALEELPWDLLFSDRTPRRKISFRRKQDDRTFLSTFHLGFKDGSFRFPSGFIQGQRLEQELGVLTLPVATVRDFDQLTIPFRAVAADAETGEAVSLSSGVLADAIRASMSLPGIFSPVPIGDRLYLDGGIAMNLPIEVVREMGADVVIAVDIGKPPLKKEEISSAFTITGQLVTIVIYDNTQDQIRTLGEDDHLIIPEIEGVGTLSFEKVVPAAAGGLESTMAQADDLARLSLSDDAWRRYREGLVYPDRTPPIIDRIRIENDSRLSERTLRARIKQREGEPLDVDTLRTDIDHLHGIDIFDRVSARFEKSTEGGHELVLTAKQRATGVNRIRFGLNVETDYQNSSTFNLGVGITRLPMNRLGAELRFNVQIGLTPSVLLEFWQPLDPKGRFFIAPALDYETDNFELFDDDGDALADYRVWRAGPQLAFGRQLGQWGETRVGIRYERSEATRIIGDPQFPALERNQGEAFVRFVMDTLDDARFPTRGTLFFAEGAFGLTELGATDDYQAVFTGLTQAYSLGPNTLLLEGQVGATFDDDREIGTLFPLGGFLRLSGLRPNQLVGSQFGLFRLRGYRRLTELGVLSFTLPVYAGFSVETGNTWLDLDDFGNDLRYGGSVYLALDTPFSPLYVAYGNTDGDNHAGYLYFGQTF